MFKNIVATLFAVVLMFAASNSYATEKGPLGDFRVGATVGAGLPSPISGQLLVKYKDVVGLNAEYGFLPELTLPTKEDVKVSQHMADFALHVYPFKGAFFLGCGVGFQNLTASSQVTDQGVTGTATASVDTVFVSPRLGFLHRFDFGLALGMDVGVQLPVSGSTSVGGQANGVQLPVPKAATDVTDTIKTTPIPIVHLLQLGYIF